MLRKSILIGLFVLNNKEDQNLFREGRKGNCPDMVFHGPVTAGTGNWGWVFAWPVAQESMGE